MAKLSPLGGGNGAHDDVSGSPLLTSQADAAPVPPARAPRRGDLLIVTACAVVFIAELAIADRFEDLGDPIEPVVSSLRVGLINLTTDARALGMSKRE